jgi:hypothetical protein
MDSVSKVLQQINELKKKEDRVEALRANVHPTMKTILQYMFDPTIEFSLPEGAPPYKESKFNQPKALLQETRRFYLLTKNGHPALKPLKREQIFIEILEFVDAEDAKLLIAMKDKKSPYKNITKDLVSTAFPELNLT